MEVSKLGRQQTVEFTCIWEKRMIFLKVLIWEILKGVLRKTFFCNLYKEKRLYNLKNTPNIHPGFEGVDVGFGELTQEL